MKTKKLLSIVLAFTLLLSVFAFNTYAAVDETKAVISIDDMACKLDGEVTVSIKATAKIANFTFIVTYPSESLTYVADSFAACDDAIMLADSSAGTIKFLRTGESKDLELDGVELASFKLAPVDGVLAEEETSKDFTIDLKVGKIDLLGDGSMLEDDCYNAGGDNFSTADDADIKAIVTGAKLSVVREHEAPSITGVKLDAEEAVLGTKITATTEGWADNWNLPDKTAFKWTIGDAVVSETAEYTPEEADLGKELVVTATPTVLEADGAEAPFTGEAKTASVKVVAAADYAPTATVTLEKVTAGKEVELGYVINKYANGKDASEYAWYVVEAEDATAAIAAAKEATPVEGVTVANPTFDKENKGKWAVVKVTAKETIGEKTYPLEGVEANVYYAAAEIKVKKSGGSAQTGASLVTGGNTVITPSTPDVDDKEDTEEPGTETPGTEAPEATDDPKGEANEAGAAAFTDVDKEAYAWAYDSIDVLAKAGVIKGMTADTFGPELTTTNAQVIALVARIAGLTAEEGATTDKVDAEHWVAAEMAAADANGILTVFGEGAIDVEGETTREVAFTLLYNALKAAGVELAETAEAIEYSDAASISEGCAEAIEALTKAGIINGMGDGTLAPKATITRAQLAKILGLADALIK